MVWQNHGRLWSMKCVLIVTPLKIHCQLVKVYGVCVIPWKQADMVHGFQQWQDRCWQVESTTDNAWCTDTSSCWHLQRARHSLGSAQNCPRPTGLHRSVCALGASDDKAHCMGLSCIYWTCYTDHREQFWSWNMVNDKAWNQKKDVWERNYHLPPAKKVEASSLVKMTMVTLSADCCGTLNLRWSFFCKRPQLLRHSIVLLHENARRNTPNWTAVYGCTSDRFWTSLNLVLSVLSVTESLKTTWLASDCSRCWCEAGYHLLATDTRQVSLPLVPLWGKCRDDSGEYAEVWCVPSASHVPCTDQIHNNILTWECLLPYLLEVLYLYIAVWAGEFMNTGCSEWWGFCVICWSF